MSFLLPLVSTACIVISAIFVAKGWLHIRRKQLQQHIRAMILAAIFAVIFFTIYASRTLFIGNTEFGGPEEVRTFYQLFLFFHIILATVGAVMGVLSLYSGYKKRYDRHRRLGPWTSVIWFSTAITGVLVFLLLYVIYPPGPTQSLFRVILG